MIGPNADLVALPCVNSAIRSSLVGSLHYLLKELTTTDEARIASLVKKVLS
jgi:hypothetical protein